MIILCQVQDMKKTDWAHQITQDMKELNLQYSFADIESMSKQQFKKIIKTACREKAFTYLQDERKHLSKGQDLQYKS